MWLCCPSTFNPDVGPSVLSDAGDPGSPIAPDVPIKAAVASGLSPMVALNGTNISARIGIVPNDVPMPIVNNNPTIIIHRAATKKLSTIQAIADSSRLLNAPDTVY